MSPDKAAAALLAMSPAAAAAALAAMPADKALAMLLAMSPAERAKFLASLPPDVAARLLASMNPAARDATLAGMEAGAAARLKSAAGAAAPLSRSGSASSVAGSGAGGVASGNDSPGGFGMAKADFSALLPDGSAARQGSGDGTTWKVDYTPGNHVMCRKCFAAIPDSALRVTAQSPSVAYYHLAKQFYHLECRAPSCPVAEVQGLQTISAKDRDIVQKAMAAAAAEASA